MQAQLLEAWMLDRKNSGPALIEAVIQSLLTQTGPGVSHDI